MSLYYSIFYGDAYIIYVGWWELVVNHQPSILWKITLSCQYTLFTATGETYAKPWQQWWAIVRYPPAPAVAVNIPLLGQVFSHLNCRVGYFNLQEPSFEFTIVGSVWFLNCWVGCLSWERSALRQKYAPCEWPKRRRKQKYMGRLTPTIQEYLE